MTTNHTELCSGLRHMGSPRAERAADLIEQQAARIQQQALEYVSLQAQCDEHLARVAEVEREKDEAEKHAAAVSSENFDLEARIAELEKERDALIHDNAQLVKAASAEATLASEALAERDALKAAADRYVWSISSADNAEFLWVAVMSCGPSARESINIEIEAALQAEKETR